ncbi:MarR family winged helix-turn-helix transcriptional regulator [Asticcacaulis machinosus]|uniref:MarR family transcriptional regulator n=1 Tax=Asticcacaulis machinosus TaxID=2984211 RepID=A0ABT5HJD4_9CAUL|nr:MarR family transcriptional regulator [Asticcacaulis machinosus]MDC7676357.1 MarR family transcriptional regulator [Asticcacaulis machinosus]
MSDNHETPELWLHNQICFAVHSTAHAFAAAYKPHLDPLNLTYPQYLVMLLLWEKDDQSVSELGKPLFLDSGTLTPLLKRLQATGYINRTRDVNDERVMRITLTDAGKALKQKAICIPHEMLGAMGLNVEQVIALGKDVRKLGQALRQN